jgi:hypothetical protein
VVDYEAATDCPTEAEFSERLSGRSANLEIAHGSAERSPRLVVRVTRAKGRVHGELVVDYPDGNEARRTVDGDVCTSVVDALALMSAMTLDPGAALSPPAEPPPEPPPAKPPVEIDAAPRALDDERGTHVAIGAAGSAVFGMAPVAAPDASGFVEVTWQRESLASPALRIGFDYASTPISGVASVAGAGVQLARTEVSLDGCPLRWSLAAFRFAPCVHLEGGGLAASGVGLIPDRSAVRPWLAAGVLANIQARIGRRFFGELTGGARVPLVRDRFYFEPDVSTTVFQAPIVSGFVGAGVGFTIL